MRFDIKPAQENFLFFASLDHQFRKTTTHDEHHLETQSYEIEENTNVCMKKLLWEGGLLPSDAKSKCHGCTPFCLYLE